MRNLWLAILLLTTVPCTAQVAREPMFNVACAVSTTPSPPTIGMFYYVQCDPNGNLLVKAMGTPGSATSIATGQVTVATTATQIVAARSGRTSVIIVNHGTTNVFLGTSTVTTTTGLLLLGSVGAAATVDGGAAVSGIVGAGTQVVSFMEMF